MATYRQIHVKIWGSPDFEEMKPEYKLLFIFLFSNNYRNEAGLYSITIKTISFCTDLDKETIINGLDYLEQKDMAIYDHDTAEMWVVNALNYQHISPQGIKSIINDLQKVKSAKLKELFILKYNDIIFKEIDENNLTLTQIIAIRDNFFCQYCGAPIVEYGDAHADHVLPKSRGGKDTYDNLVLSCSYCNCSKGTKTAAEFGYPDVKGTPFHISKIPNLLKDNVIRKTFQTVFYPNGVFRKQDDLFKQTNTPFNKENDSSTGKGKDKGIDKTKGKKDLPSNPSKIKFAEFVTMTNDEYASLVQKLGNEDRVKRCIEILDNFKGANGKKYKSDYRAILTWVIDRLVEEERKAQTAKPYVSSTPKGFKVV